MLSLCELLGRDVLLLQQEVRQREVEAEKYLQKAEMEKSKVGYGLKIPTNLTAMPLMQVAEYGEKMKVVNQETGAVSKALVTAVSLCFERKSVAIVSISPGT